MNISDAEYIQNQETLAGLADTFLDQAMNEGHPFSEELCDWASRKAERKLGNPSSEDFGHPDAAIIESPPRDLEKEAFC